MSPTPAIRFDGVHKSFASASQGDLALGPFDLEVPEGAFVTLLGPSGCGKTTVLRLADGLIAPDGGSVSIFGAPPKPGPDIGFVFQSFRLLPWATARGNIEFGLRSRALPRAERTERADHWLDLVGLTRFAEHFPGQLSGGMRQRVALARAFACEPRLLLMDEPFASLDAQTRELMQGELLALWGRHASTVLFVTHSVDEAIVLSDSIALMGPRPGRVVEWVEVPLERPRGIFQAREDARFADLRSHLARRMRASVLADPQSDFFGRGLGS